MRLITARWLRVAPDPVLNWHVAIGARKRQHCFDATCTGLFLSSGCFWVLLTVLCSEREKPFFVPPPAIGFPERAEGVKGPKRQRSLAAYRPSVACVSQRLDA
jgi:hypothetical protein